MNHCEAKSLYEVHKSFWGDYFKNADELDRFVLEKITYEKDVIPIRLINTVQRLVTLSEEIGVIRPGSRDLTIFFILTCIETLYTLVPGKKMNKQETIIDFFNNYLCQEDKNKIQENIHILMTDSKPIILKDINIEQFSLMLTAVRNNLAHEGIYWGFHFSEKGSEDIQLNIFNSKLKKDEGYREITYEVGITYKDFKLAIMRAFIKFINEYC